MRLVVLLALMICAKYTAATNLIFVGSKKTIDITEAVTWHPNFTVHAPEAIIKDTENLNQYHILPKSKRQEVITNMGISEDDNVYLYHFSTDRLIVRKVKELPVAVYVNAWFNTNDPSEIYRPEEYDVVLEVDDLPTISLSKDLEYWQVFNYSIWWVKIAKTNPFQQGTMKQLVKWHPVGVEDFPSSDAFHLRPDLLTDKEAYQVRTGEWRYVMYLSGSRRVLRAYKKGELINQLSFLGSEGGRMGAITDLWVGQAFKGAPPMIFDAGAYHTFGCNYIIFLHKTKVSEEIACNNRH